MTSITINVSVMTTAIKVNDKPLKRVANNNHTYDNILDSLVNHFENQGGLEELETAHCVLNHHKIEKFTGNWKESFNRQLASFMDA